MTTTQSAPTTDTLVVIPTTSTNPIPEKAPKPRHTKALVVGGILTALVIGAVAGGLTYLARDDAPAAATTPTVVGTIEDNSAVVHGGAGQLATVDGLPLGATGPTSSSGSVETGTSDPTIAHGSGDGVVTSSGLVHG